MGSLNKVQLIGNLGADPELKSTPTGRSVCNLRLATNEVWKDKEGKKQEKVEWHRITVWGDDADNCQKYLSKGRQIYVEGRLETRKYQDKDGNDRYSTDVVSQRIVYLGGKDEGGGGSGRSSGGSSSSGGGRTTDSSGGNGGGSAPPDDDIPF